MPVTTRVTPVEVRYAPAASTYSPEGLFKQVCPELCSKSYESGKRLVIQSSFPESITLNAPRHFGSHGVEHANGFVGTILDAYRRHNHVVIRPEDVWFAISTQFSLYVTTHSSQMREHFVDHAGKKKLEVEQSELDMADFAIMMAQKIDENIKDKEFHDWAMPNFTTTTASDRVTASIIMMGTMSKYFVYFDAITCGIPSVTLLGEQKDWQNMLHRIEYLSRFAASHRDIASWQARLRGLLKNMVDTFEAPDSPEVVQFWQHAVHSYEDGCNGENFITGWILAFMFWNDKRPLVEGFSDHDGLPKPDDKWWIDQPPFPVSWDDVPAGYIHVPVHINNHGEKFVAKAVAGSVGYVIRDSEQIFRLSKVRPGHDADQKDAKIDSRLLRKASAALKLLGRWIVCDFETKFPALATEEKPKPVIEYGTIVGKSRNQFTQEPMTSDLSELDQPWPYAAGGKNDTLQPVSGWWVVRTEEGTYGRDPDVPDVQFDDDAEDFDHDLAYNGRPLRG